ncbi:MAG: hypothetical protein U9O89_03720 [Thermoproteota archaeon]|nr:hypothetical protein [Thermoproteota archaeon]
MHFDILLPSILFFITAVIIFFHSKHKRKIRSLLEEKELKIRDVVSMVALMGVVVTVLVFIPQYAIMTIFLCMYSFILYLATYLIVPKWYLAPLTPAVFIFLYLFSWNTLLLNVFATIFVIFISVYLGSLFTWKTTAIFATLLTVMDIIQVLGTQFMVASASKMLALQLPVMIVVPTFPVNVGLIALGLGDLFLSGLLSIQTAEKYGKKMGCLSALSIAVTFAIFEFIQLHCGFHALPATVFIVTGWLISLGARYLRKLYRNKRINKLVLNSYVNSQPL